MADEKDDQPDFGSTGHENPNRHAVTDSLSPQPYHNEEEISILDILIVLAKHKKLILGLPFLAGIIAAGITLLMPNWYTGTAKILPPQPSHSNAVAILGQLGAMGGGATQAIGIKNPNDVFVAMLNSRTVADSLIEKFDLKTIYGKELMTDVRKSLANNTSIASGKDGVIAIEVDDKDPKRAADLANAYVSQLEVLTINLAVSEAGKRRLFFEKQLQTVKEALTSAEVALQKSQELSGIINPAGQASLSVAAAAGLRAQITATQVQISTLRTFAAEQNPDLIRTESELAGLRRELARMRAGAGLEKGDVLLSIGKAPKASLDYLKKYRDVKYYETLFELLAKQYELARIDEAKDATLIQVLDKAIQPERKSRPKRSLIVLLTAFVAGLLAVFWAFVREALSRARLDSELSRRLQLFLGYLAGR